MRTRPTLAALALCLALLPFPGLHAAAAPAATAGPLRAAPSYDPDFRVWSTLPPARVFPRVVPQFTPATPGHPGVMRPLGPLLPPTLLDGQVVVRPRVAGRPVSVVLGRPGDDVLVLQAPPPSGAPGGSPATVAAMRFDPAGMRVVVTATCTVLRDGAGRTLTLYTAPDIRGLTPAASRHRVSCGGARDDQGAADGVQ